MQSKTFLISTFAISIILAGCGTSQNPTVTRFAYKPGSTHISKQRDTDQCKIESFKHIPQTITQTVSGGSYTAGSVRCTNYSTGTSCYTIGERYSAPEIVNRDENKSIRNRFIQDCLEKKGYSFHRIPLCQNETGYNTANPAPALSQIHCIDQRSPNIEK